jgi:PAS domain S-box-containing protein
VTLGSTEHAWALDAIANIDDGIIVVDAEMRVVYVNHAAQLMLGANELNSMSSWDDQNGIFHPDKVTPFRHDELPLFMALRTGKPERDVPMYARTRSRPDGFHIQGSATPLVGEGKVRGAVAIFRDVTLVHQRESQLSESERQKKAILDNIPDIAWLKDREGRYVAVNSRLVEAANRTKHEELIGLTDLDLWPRDLAEAYRADDAIVMQTGERRHIEEQMVILATGERRWIETVKTRIVDDEGNVTGTTGIAHDITARKLAQDELEQRIEARTRELREAQENLVRQERLAVLGQLAGGVAHQIRNPLAAIMNATYVMQRHHAPTAHPNVLPAIRIIQDEVRHANIIITGLLDYARVRTPDRHPTSLSELLERILNAEWIPDSVHITHDLPPEDPVMLNIDADQLTGAVANLVRNAIEAMPAGGTLDVTLQRIDEQVSVLVRDSGTGIPPQVRAHLFEPLHSTKPLGIGLGLVTARRFVEAHGGTIMLMETPVGAAFEIRLPNR